MNYATREDLRLSDALLTWLTTDGVDGLQMPDDQVIADALSAADNRINAHLRNRYTLPVTDPDQVLRDLAVKLARYWLYERKPDGPEMPAMIVDAKAQAERDLVAIRDGRMSLGGSSTDPTPATETGRTHVSAPDRTFTADLLGRY